MDNEIAFWNWTSISGAVEDSIRELETLDSDPGESPVVSVNTAVILLAAITLISLILLCVLSRYSVQEATKSTKILASNCWQQNLYPEITLLMTVTCIWA